MDKTQDAELTLDVMRLMRDFMTSDDARAAIEGWARESRIKSRNMSNGRRICYPASWDEPERRTLRPDQARRCAT